MTEFDPTRWVPDPDFKAPDVIGTVEGWRAWGVPANLPDFGVPPKLYSVTHKVKGTPYYWTPRQKARAECRRCGADEVPGEHCACGFYSAKTVEHLMSMRYHEYDADGLGMYHVVGRVANWGKVIECSSGWRSAFSYPVHLYIPFEAFELAKPLQAAYGVPVSLKNHLKPVRRRPL
jgi:ribosomal protein L37E